MTTGRAAFVVPGGVRADTGGNIYDRVAIGALRRRGWDVAVTETAEGPFDVVLVDSLAMPGGLPATSAPVVGVVHQLPSEAAGRAPSRGELEVVRKADVIVAVSAWLAERLRALGVRRVAVVRPGRDRAWAAEGPRADAVSALCVANAFPGKGIPEAVAAFSAAGARDVGLRLAGDLDADANEAVRVREAIERSVAPVEALGVLSPSQLSILYGEALVLLTASRYEGWPISVAEAMASGIPVVGYDVAGVAELVRNGVDGVLVPPGDTAALSRAVRSVCSDPRLRADLGTSARERALAWPTWEEVGERFAEIVERVADQASGAPYAP